MSGRELLLTRTPKRSVDHDLVESRRASDHNPFHRVERIAGDDLPLAVSGMRDPAGDIGPRWRNPGVRMFPSRGGPSTGAAT